MSATVTDEKNFTEHPATVAQKPPGWKTAPPVAPKPAWIHQSLRKIRNDQEQRKHAISSEEKSPAGLSRSFKDRSASSGGNMSIKQKIHSFESFSSPGPQDRRSSVRRPTASSTSVSLMEKPEGLCSFSSGSDVEHENIQHEFPKEMKSDQSTCDGEKNNGEDTVQTSGNTSATLEDGHQSKPPENQPPFNEFTTNPELSLCDTRDSDPNVEKYDAHQSLVHNNANVPTSKQESEPEKVDIDELKECDVPSATTSRTSENEAKICSDEEVEKTPGEPLKTSQSPAPPTENQGLNTKEGEQFGKIIAFSNQVTLKC